MSFPAGEFPAESVHPPPVPAGHPLRPQHPHLRARQVGSHWWSGPSTRLSLVRRSSKIVVNNRMRRSLDVATNLSIIVLIFIICHSFKFVINLVEFLDMFSSRHGMNE